MNAKTMINISEHMMMKKYNNGAPLHLEGMEDILVQPKIWQFLRIYWEHGDTVGR